MFESDWELRLLVETTGSKIFFFFKKKRKKKKRKKQDDILGEIQLVEEKERIDYCGYILLT